jgi:hypothetical protein
MLSGVNKAAGQARDYDLPPCHIRIILRALTSRPINQLRLMAVAARRVSDLHLLILKRGHLGLLTKNLEHQIG